MITWTNNKGETVDIRKDYEGKEFPLPTFEGRVFLVAGEDVRIMSDVWDWITYAHVINYKNEIEKIAIQSWCFENKELKAHVTVDATPEVLARVAEIDREREVQAAAIEKAHRIQYARTCWDAPDRGKRMVVFKGRKVTKGTEGVVFWMGKDNFGGTKVGLALSEARDERGRYTDVAWISAANLKNALPFEFKA